MLLAWKTARVITYAGYILGFPNDTVESIMHDIDVIKRELPVDLLEFFYLTPLPGSEDHLKLVRAGVALESRPEQIRPQSHLHGASEDVARGMGPAPIKLAWQHYYTIDHVETMLRRVASTEANASNALFLITWFKGSIDIENIHPLEGGFLRLKFRRDRRPDRPIEPVWQFYPRYFAETAVKLVRWSALYLRLRRIYLRIKKDPQRFAYTDLAMTPVSDEESDARIFKTDAAQAYVAQEDRLEKIRHAGDVKAAAPAL